MRNETAIMLGFLWFLTLAWATFFGHEVGLMKSEHEIRMAKKGLDNCNRIIVGDMYAPGN